MTYSLKINFSSGRVYAREGLTWEAAQGLKEYFIERVPAAVSGSVTPENKKSRDEKGQVKMSKATPPQIVSALLHDFYGSYERAIAYCEKITKHSGPLSGDYLAAKDLLLSKQGAPKGRSK